MKGADDLVAFNAAPVPEVCAEVRAVGCEEGGGPLLATEQDIVLAEVAKRFDVSGLEILAPTHEIPAPESYTLT